MPRKLRFQPEEWSTFFVTSKCIHSRFLLRPSQHSNQLIIGVIAKGVSKFYIKLHALCVMSNHYRLGCHTNSLSNILNNWTTP